MRGYPREFPWRVLDLVEASRKVAEVAEELGISDQTIYNSTGRGTAGSGDASYDTRTKGAGPFGYGRRSGVA